MNSITQCGHKNLKQRVNSIIYTAETTQSLPVTNLTYKYDEPCNLQLYKTCKACNSIICTKHLSDHNKLDCKGLFNLCTPYLEQSLDNINIAEFVARYNNLIHKDRYYSSDIYSSLANGLKGLENIDDIKTLTPYDSL